jgi:K+-transporting ATPase ATPase A chain
MRWTEYTISTLLFSGVSMALLYFIERTQHWLPFNPQKFTNVDPSLAWGTAASFTTNTNWQAYSGEATMSYFTQMMGLAYHNFVSAAWTAVGFLRRTSCKCFGSEFDSRQLSSALSKFTACEAAMDL